ncbi:MAG TPA: cysteine desulfurase family protein [Anaerolineales bacterium]|nr:cysteine desulfurase family protein [Anaerolineales bacterium]
MNKIYFDYAATTPVDPRVLDAMLPYFTESFGNPSSIHMFGQKAEAALETARETMARLLNCKPNEIIFTSCGSESDNLALRGVAHASRTQRNANGRDARHILISPVEHHAVSHTAEQLAHLFGFELEYLPVDEYGMVHPDDVATRIRPDTALVSIILANNEIGTINPIAEIGAVCQEQGVPLHTDAVQAGAHLRLDVQALKVDLMSIGAHKFYGPKGVGALYVREGIPIVPTQTGGGQEFGLRAGTSNIPYIVGMAAAFELAQREINGHPARLVSLRDRLIGQVLEEIGDAQLTGHPVQRLPNHASFVFKGVDGNALLAMLDVAGFACSSGSACKSGLPEPSEVLTMMGLPREWALGSLRMTLGKYTIPQEIELFLQFLPDAIQRARNAHSR